MKKILLLIIVFLPLVTLAQGGYTLLEPSVIGGGDPRPDLITYLQKAFNTLITVAIVIAMASIVYGGAMYILSGTPMKINNGKTIMENALYGLLLILTSWLILNTINPDLVNLKLDLSFSGSRTNTNVGGSGTTNPPADPNTSNPNNSPTGGVVGPSQITEQEARNQLTGAGFQIADTNPNDGIGQPCFPDQTTGCTSLEGIQQNTINGVIGLQNICSTCGTLVITGGTERGHDESTPYSHLNGYKVDLNNTPQLRDFIERSGNFRRSPTNTNGFPTYTGRITYENNTYDITILDESDHFDYRVIKP